MVYYAGHSEQMNVMSRYKRGIWIMKKRRSSCRDAFSLSERTQSSTLTDLQFLKCSDLHLDLFMKDSYDFVRAHQLSQFSSSSSEAEDLC